MAGATTLKNAPDARSSDAFVLHAGLKVRILDRVAGWVKVRIPDGNVAWIEQEAIAVI
jgi:SH3-like domain-containing protein